MAASIGAAAVALAPAPSLARDVPGASEVSLEWAPAAGEVGAYVVFVSRDGGPYRSEQYTRAPRARVGGRLGETVQVLVRAYALSDGRALASVPSEPSETIRFVPAEPAPSSVSAAPPSVAPPVAALPAPGEARALPVSQFAPTLAIQASGDFDGDGELDLIGTFGSPQHPVALFMKRGSLDHLACLAPFPASSTLFGADVDGDGRDELAVAGGIGLSVLRLDRPGTMTLLRQEPLPRGATVLAADLDGHGSASLVSYDPATGRLVERSPPPGQMRDFGTVRPLRALRAGDFDGDGRDDLWVQSRPGEAELWMMREDGRFEVAPLRFEGELQGAATLDWNGDGRDDLAGFDPAHGELRAWLLDGARLIDRRVLARGPVESVRALDLDGDGHDDLLVSAPGGAESALFSTP
jgi:FG-GAP-like repeat/FG-GAP repeat